jgi:hypothetical protein
VAYTGHVQQELAEIIAEYAKRLSHGELRAALRLGKPDIFDATCILCNAKLSTVCSNPECSGFRHLPSDPDGEQGADE